MAEAVNSVKGLVLPPNLSPLNLKSDNMLREWEYWHRSFERYCRMAKLVKEEDKKDVFFSYIGRETEDYIRDLPNFDSLTTCAQLVEVVRARYTKVPNSSCERYTFRNVNILPKESIEDFNARLNTFSKHCEFNAYSRDLAHLDQIILNAPTKLREKLLMEKELTLVKALEIARYAHLGSDWCNQFQEDRKEVNWSRNTKFGGSNKLNHKVNKPKNDESNKKLCYRCGSNQHLANFKSCPALKIVCNKCSKKGHFAKHCLLGKSKSEVNQVTLDDSIDKLNVLPVMVNSCSSSHKYININLNDKLVKFVIDSGSQATLVPLNVFKSLNLKLQPTSVSLIDYNQNSIKCLGECYVKVTKESDSFKSKFYVTNEGLPLLGTD